MFKDPSLATSFLAAPLIKLSIKLITFFSRALKFTKNLLVYFALITLVLEQFLFVFASTARAAELPITPDGSTNTQIDRAANNVPIVNIAAPNAGGLSHNKFESYNVNPSGLILNNAIGSHSGVVQTQIGGLINDNANLRNSGAASIILNEVTSSNISQINGYTEIAGKQADLVLANPNGFVMNGAGFVNVSRVTTVVGSSNQFNPNPADLTFKLSDNSYLVANGFLPKLTIAGAGLDLESVTSTDLVASVMNIVAPIYGGTNEVNIRSGDQAFSYATKEVTSDNTNPGSNLPDEVAIDASNLGKIQAGRIFIKATKEGFGIKYSGDLLAQRNGINIDAQGNITYNNALSEVGNIEVTSHKGKVTTTGISKTKNANSDIKISAKGNITNSGQFISARNINIESTFGDFRNKGSALNLSDNDFTIKAINFTNLGQIAANRDLDITATGILANGTLTNAAKLVGARNLILTAPQITNDDSIYAGNKISITANDYLTNNKDIISLGVGLTTQTIDDGILIVAKTLNNNKQIAAKNNITINSNILKNNTANSSILALNNIDLNVTSLDNSNASIRGLHNLTLRNLLLNSPQTANSLGVTSGITDIKNAGGTFYAGSLLDFDLGNLADYSITGSLQSSGNIKIKANNILNKGVVEADGYIKIEANSKFANGLVNASNKDVKIISENYLDITAASSIANYGTLSAKTDLTLKSINGDVNNGSFAREVANFLTSLFDENSSTAKLDDYFSGKQLDLLSKLKSDPNTNLTNADSASLLLILRDFLNSKQKTDNKILPDNFASKTSWDLYNSLKSHINNNKSYYQIQVTPNSSRIAAEIISGTGKLSLIAKNGAVNQNSLHSIVANGNYSLDVLDFINTGRVDVAGNLTLNVANNLTNEENAMIYAGGTMDLNVVNNLTNKTGAAIYSEGNLTIQKYSTTSPFYNPANNRINKLNNLSGEITSYTGNINIYANEINNKRTSIYTQNTNRWIGPCYGYQWETHCSLHEEAKYSGSITPQAKIYAGNNININSGYLLTDLSATSLTNQSSSIIAKNNIDLNIGTLNNNSNSFKSYTKFLDHPYWWTRQSDWNWRIDQLPYLNLVEENFPAIFKAGHDFDPHVVNDISNEDLIKNVSIDPELNKTPNLVNGINIGNLLNNGVVDADLSSYLNGPDTQGLFQKSTNPNGPLFETRSQFIDQSQFFGSNYFYTRIGLNLADVQTEFEQTNKRLVGDQFFQTKIIEEQLQTISKNSFLLSSNETNINNEIKSLLDNAANEYTRLGLTTNTKLNQTQINSLQKDIIWFETEIINGSAYVVPKIYLSQATRDNLKNNNLIATGATIYAGNNVNLTSTNGKITNQGSITGNNVTLVANGDITNKNFSTIKALNDLSLTSSTGSINNFSQIAANNAVTLIAAKDITNSATVSTNDADLLNSGNPAYIKNGADARSTGNISSKLVETAGITGGSVTIDAGNDFNNTGSNITSTAGNISIVVGNDVNIETAVLRNRTETNWGSKKKGGTSISDTTTNIGSNITSSGNLDIKSTGLSATATTGDINIIGSNVTAAGNGSLTSDFGNVNIANAVDSKMTEETSFKSGTFYSRYDSVYDYKETAAESKLNFGGNLAVNAELGTMNLIGSTLKTSGDLNVGSFTVTQNPDGSYKTNADGTFQTVDGGSVAGVNIKAAELRSEHSEVHQKSKLTLGDTLKTLADPVEMAKLYLDVYLFMATPSFKKDVLEFNNGPKYEKSSEKSNTATITQHSGALDVGGNMMVNSTKDVNIAASNVDVAGNVLMNVDGNINVTSAAEKTTSSNKKEEIEIGTFKLTKDLAHASASAGVEGTGSKFEDSLTATTQKSSNINIGGSMLANVTNNLSATDSGNMTLAASNLTVNGDSIIKTAGDFNLTDAQEASSYSSKESTLTVEAGAKVGNAYVDAAYAWKAVVDAQKKAIEAVEKLKKMERLQDEGKATSKAVQLAAAQVVLAQTAVATASFAAAAATAGAASAASTSFGTGMYGAGYLNTTATGIKNTTDTSISKASNFVGNGDINIASNNNANILGSVLASRNGNVTLGAAKDIKIEAGTNTLNQKSKQETIYGGGSVGNNGVQLNIGMSQGESDYNKTSYTNSQVSAENGTLTLNTGNDANISGANLLAKNVSLNIGNNLNVSSKQTEEDYSSSGYGFNFGVGVGSGGNGGNIGGGFNMNNADMHRLWVDNITTIKGTDSMAVNVAKDLNLTGAAILSDNLALAVTGNINKKELQDSYYSESMGIGVSTNFTTSGSQPTIPGTGGQPNQFPGGSTSISGNYAQNESSRTVYATIGGLDSTLVSATKDVTGGDFEGSLTIDHRLLSEAGRNDILKQLNYSKDLAAIPIETLSETYKQKGEVKVAADGTKQGGGTNFLDSLGNKYSTLQDLMFNPKVTAKDLTKDSKELIAYNGNKIDPNSDAAGASGFYDRKSDTSAINVVKNQSDSQLAGSLSHENYHAQVDNKGIAYSQAEENTAHNIGDFTQSRWDVYQSGNTNFQSTLPMVIATNNSYANSVVFNNDVNPLLPLAIPAASALITGILAHEGKGDAFKGAEKLNNTVAQTLAPAADKVITGADVIANKLNLTEEGNTPVRNYVVKTSEDYNALLSYIPEESRQALGVLGLTLGVGGAASGLGKGLFTGTELEVGSAAGNLSSNTAATTSLPAIYYPQNSGFLAQSERTFLMPGTKIDRYGDTGGHFFAPTGTPVTNRSIPGTTDTSIYNSYEVVKPFEVKSGISTPAYSQDGYGTQFISPVSAKILEQRGIIKPTTITKP